MARKPYRQPTTQAATQYGTTFPQKIYGAGSDLFLKVRPIDTFWYITIHGPMGEIFNRKTRLDLLPGVLADIAENWSAIESHAQRKHDHLTHESCPLCKQGF